MIEVREMSVDDWEEVSRIYQAGIETAIATFMTEAPDYETWHKRHLVPCRLVATRDDRILAWAALSSYSVIPAYQGVAEVSVYVDPVAKGQGVGTMLLEAMSEEAKKHGFWSLQSRVIKANTASINLHVKCGYRKIGYHERIARNRFGEWLDTVLMEKRL